MAKQSKIAANERRKRVVARHAERRRELKEVVRTASDAEQRDAAVRPWPGCPATPARCGSANRDQVDGRPRGYLRKVGLSRINLRTLAHRGELRASRRRRGEPGGRHAQARPHDGLDPQVRREVGQQGSHPAVHLVADAAYRVGTLAGGVGEASPRSACREDRAGVAAAHRDDDVGRRDVPR